MKIIHNTDLSASGNDCYIYKSVTLFEDLGLYGVLTTEKTVGWYVWMLLVLIFLT